MADSSTQTQQAPGQGQASAPAAGVTVGPISPLSLDEMLEAELAGQTDTPETPAPKAGRKAKRQAPKAQAKEDNEVIDEIDNDLKGTAPEETAEDDVPTEEEPEAQEEEADAEEETPEDNDTETQDAETEEDSDATTDEAESEDEASFEKLPPSWQRTVKKMRSEAKSLRERLKAESARTAPTPDSPLANVVTEQELAQTLAHAKRVKQLFGKVSDVDFAEDRNGKEVYTIEQGNQSYSYTRDQIQHMLNQAEQVLDPEVVLERRQYLNTRQQIDPLETAERIVPGIVTDKDSDAAKWMNRVLETVPALRKLPDFEVLLAHAHRDFQRQQETQPSKTHPKGKVKWVRYELDKDGKVLPPKQKASSANGSKPAAQAPSSPTGRRAPAAPVRPEGRARANFEQQLATKTSLSSSEDIAAMLNAELAAG
jgi:hypothetical protein